VQYVPAASETKPIRPSFGPLTDKSPLAAARYGCTPLSKRSSWPAILRKHAEGPSAILPVKGPDGPPSGSFRPCFSFPAPGRSCCRPPRSFCGPSRWIKPFQVDDLLYRLGGDKSRGYLRGRGSPRVLSNRDDSRAWWKEHGAKLTCLGCFAPAPQASLTARA